MTMRLLLVEDDRLSENNTIEVFVHSLRKRLGTDYILTVRGVGYAGIGER